MKKVKGLIAGILSLLMIMTSIPLMPITSVYAEDSINVIVKVVDSDDEAIEGADVKIGSDKVKTDVNGEAAFAVEAGEYSVTVSNDGYKTVEVGVVDLNSDCTVPVKLLKEKKITGTVTSKTGEDFDSLEIAVTDSETNGFKQNGNKYEFTAVEGKTYIVTASAKNHTTQAKDITIDTNAEECNITLPVCTQTVTVKVDGKGNYKINGNDPVTGDIDIDVNENTATITAQADEHYHVASITGVDTDYTNNEAANAYINEKTEVSANFTLEKSKREIKVVFAINRYDISIDGNIKNGTVEVQGNITDAAYGETITIVAKPETYTKNGRSVNYNVVEISANNTSLNYNNLLDDNGNIEDNGKVATTTIAGATTVSAKFSKINSIKSSDVALDFGSCNVDSKSNTYYYKSAATIKNSKYLLQKNSNQGLAINQFNVDKTETITIYVLKEDLKWYYVADESDNIINFNIVIDGKAPKIESFKSSWVKGEKDVWTNEAGAVSFEVTDVGDSGLDKVYYSDKDSKNVPADATELTAKDGKYTIDFTEAQEKTYYIYAIDKSGNISKKDFDVRIDTTAPIVTDIDFTVKEGTITNVGELKKIASNTVTVSVTANDAAVSSKINKFTLSLSDVNEGKENQITVDAKSNSVDENGIVTATAEFTIDKELLLGLTSFSTVTVVATDNAGNNSDSTNDAQAESNYKEYLLMISEEEPSGNIEPSTPTYVEYKLDEKGEIVKDEKGNDVVAKKWYSGDLTFDVDVQAYSNKEDLQTGINNVVITLNGEVVVDVANGTGKEIYYDANLLDSYRNDRVISSKFKIDTANHNAVNGKNTLNVVVTTNNGKTKPITSEVYIDRGLPYVTNVKAEKSGSWLASLIYGVFSNEKITLNVTVADDSMSSGIDRVELYKDGEENPFKTVGVSKIQTDNNNVTETVSFELVVPKKEDGSANENDAFVGNLSLVVVDNVGHNRGAVGVSDGSKHKNAEGTTGIVSNIESNYFCLEASQPKIETTIIEKTLNVNANTFPANQIWYNTDQKIDVTYTDPTLNDEKVKKESGLYLIKAELVKVDKADGSKEVVEVIDSKDLTKTTDDNGKEVNATNPTWEETLTFDTANLDIREDFSYHFVFTAVDNAGNECVETKTIYVDTNAPAITEFYFGEKDYQDSHGHETTPLKPEETEKVVDNEKVVEKDYGYYFKETTVVTITADDKVNGNESCSGVKAIEYMLIDKNGIVTKQDTVNVEKDGSIQVKVKQGFKGQIIARAIDNVKNIGDFTNPDGVILEKNAPKLTFDNLVTAKGELAKVKDGNKHDLFAENVVVGFTATDADSGIRRIDWKVEAPYDTDKNSSGYVVIGNDGTIEDQEKAYKPYSLSDNENNLIHKVQSAILVKNNSNDIKVTITVTDRSGNEKSFSKTLSIDKTSPKISITFKDENKQTGNTPNMYNTDRTAVITIKERNFNPALITAEIKALDPDFDSVPDLKKIYKIKNWTPVDWNSEKNKYNPENPDDTTYRIEVVFRGDGKYGFTASLTDKVLNKSNKASTKFTIDGTAPEITVEYESEAKELTVAENDSKKKGDNNSNLTYYYNKSVKVTITVKEHNFDSSLLENLITAKNNGDDKKTFDVKKIKLDFKPSKDKDTYVAVFELSDNFEYDVKFGITDKAGNKAETNEVSNRIVSVDKDKPVLNIEGIKTAKYAAYNSDNIIPVLTISDKDGNLDPSKVTVKLKGRKDIHAKETVYSPTEKDVAKITKDKNGYVFTLTDFQKKVIDTDDIYNLVVEAEDKAGNAYKYECYISVNRFGSTYECNYKFDDNIAYTTSILGKTLFKEVNCDFFTSGKTVLTLTYTNKDHPNSETIVLNESTDYVITKPLKKKNTYNIKTYEYKLINEKLFSQDGVYELTVTTYDEAGNTNKSNEVVNKEKNTQKLLNFIVDNNAPVIDTKASLENVKLSSNDKADDTVVTIRRGDILDDRFSKDGKSATIDLDISEKNVPIYAVDFDSVKVVYNDNEVSTEITDNNSGGKTVEFVLAADESGFKTGHKLEVTVSDKAGNNSTLVYDDLLVSNNWFVRLVNDTPRFVALIASIVVAIAGVVVFIILRKKRKDEEEDD